MMNALATLTHGLTSNLPLGIPFAADGLVGAFILAQNVGIDGVPAEFVKNFLIMFGFVTIGAGAYIFGRRGSKGNPMHIEQPVSVDATVSHAPVYALATTLDKLRSDMEARTRENLRQHEEASKQLAAVIEAGNDRLQSMLHALHEMESRMTTATLSEIRSIHERINPLAEQTASNRTGIEALQGRLSHLWEMIQSLWAQVFRKPAPRS
jgi:hypothetical protein